jgi:hypothetical protein
MTRNANWAVWLTQPSSSLRPRPNSEMANHSTASEGYEGRERTPQAMQDLQGAEFFALPVDVDFQRLFRLRA